MRELILALVAALLLHAAGMTALYRTGRPAPDDADPTVIRRQAEDGLTAAISMLIAARRAWAEAASRPGRHAGGHRG